jgi:3-hydroxyacyl-[acyl-carrier-protein] dehydratase
MSIEAIKTAIPHREPFLLIDEIVEQTGSRIVCRKRFTDDEFWYPGHYPEYPLTPGVLLLESAMQAGAVLLSNFVEDKPDNVPVVTRINNVKFKLMVRPGDTIDLDVTLKEQMSGTYFMNASVLLGGKTAVTFEFACKMAPRKRAEEE